MKQPQEIPEGLSLGERKKLVSLLEHKTTFHWLAAAAIDWALILGAIKAALWFHHPAGYVMALFVVGNRQHALSVLGHDGAHYAIHRNRTLNDLLACVFAWWPLWVGIWGYRRFHFRHHQFVGTELDPELDIKAEEAPEWDLPQSRRTRILYFLKDSCGLSAHRVLNLMKTTRPVRPSDLLGPLAWWAAAIAVLIRTESVMMLPLWFAAMPTTFWAFFRVRVYHEHMGTGGTHRVHLPWWYRELFAPHHIWVHYEHHRWPSMSYPNLLHARALDRSVPVQSVFDLIGSFGKMRPIPSGTPLRALIPLERNAKIPA